MRDRAPRLFLSILSLLIHRDTPVTYPCKVNTSGRPGRGHRDGLWQTLFAILIATGLLVVLHETGKFVRVEYVGYLWIWLPVLLLLLVVLKQRPAAFPLHPIPRPLRPAFVLLVFMLLALFTGWPEHRWFYFLRWNRPTWPHLWGPSTIAMVFFVLTALLTPLFLRPRKWLASALWILLALVMIHCLLTLYQHTGWILMIRDDHPSFAFRIWKVSEVFPRLESYVPFWNGGEIHAYALTSGAIGPALLMYPFIKWSSIEQVHTPAIGVLFIMVVPLLAVWAARIAGLRRSSQVAAGFLALCTTQFYHLWLVQFGTIGANFAAAFVMPFAACLYRVLFFQDHSVKLGVYTVIAGVFLLMWPPGAAMAGLVTLGVLVNVKQWNWPTWRFLLICAGCVALVHARQYLVIAGSDIWGLITEDSPDPEVSTGLFVLQLDWLLDAKGWLRAHFRQAHPLILFLGLAGVFVAPRRSMRRFYVPIVIGMTLLTMAGPEIVPALQLERMIIPLLFAAVIPAALCVGALLDMRGAQWALPRAMLVALLILTGANVQRLWNNEGLARHQIASPEYFDMVDFIQREVPTGTRLLFAGRTVHSYGGGHVALLPYLTGREMMACDYYHFDPAQIEYNYPTRIWRESPESIPEFLRLYNVSMVTTRRPEWRERFRAQPERYEEVASFWDERVTFFRVTDADHTPFVKGKGRAQGDLNRIAVRLDDPDAEAVLSYNWHPRLYADDDRVELFPFDAGRGAVLIGIRPQGVSEFTIRHRNRL